MEPGGSLSSWHLLPWTMLATWFLRSCSHAVKSLYHTWFAILLSPCPQIYCRRRSQDSSIENSQFQPWVLREPWTCQVTVQSPKYWPWCPDSIFLVAKAPTILASLGLGTPCAERLADEDATAPTSSSIALGLRWCEWLANGQTPRVRP